MVPGICNNSQVYLNGRFMPIEEAKISVLDRGFIFGDGVYEVIPVYRRKPFCLKQHISRFESSISELKINSSMTKEKWISIIYQLINKSEYLNTWIYLQVTRGSYRREHAFPEKDIPATIFAMIYPFDPPSEETRCKGLEAIGIPDKRWLHCNIKSISLLGNVLAKQKAVEANVDEVLQFRDGILTEGSSSNIWLVSSGKLLAPVNGNLILEGVRYNLLIELARKIGISFEARDLSEIDVITADELILTSALKEILPIVKYNNKIVGNGVPGPVFLQLRSAYDSLLSTL